MRSPDQNFNLEPSSYKRECLSLDGDARLSAVLPGQLPGGGETANYKPQRGQAPLDWDTNGASSEYQAGGSSTGFIGWKKETQWGRKEELTTSKTKEETKGREKGEKLRERQEASSSKQTRVTA
jgi:hypothetical protein